MIPKKELDQDRRRYLRLQSKVKKLGSLVDLLARQLSPSSLAAVARNKKEMSRQDSVDTLPVTRIKPSHMRNATLQSTTS